MPNDGSYSKSAKASKHQVYTIKKLHTQSVSTHHYNTMNALVVIYVPVRVTCHMAHSWERQVPRSAKHKYVLNKCLQMHMSCPM